MHLNDTILTHHLHPVSLKLKCFSSCFYNLLNVIQDIDFVSPVTPTLNWSQYSACYWIMHITGYYCITYSPVLSSIQILGPLTCQFYLNNLSMTPKWNNYTLTSFLLFLICKCFYYFLSFIIHNNILTLYFWGKNICLYNYIWHCEL